MHVTCPNDEVEAAGGQRALGIIEIRAAPIDAEAALGGGVPPAVEAYDGNIEGGDLVAVGSQEQCVPTGAAGHVERAPAGQTRQPLREQRGGMGAAFVCALSVTRVPLVAFGGAHASEADDDLAEEIADWTKKPVNAHLGYAGMM